MEAISPLTGTYFTLLPVELRRLLYLYFNTLDMTYNSKNIGNMRAILTYIHVNNINLDIYTDRTSMNVTPYKGQFLSFINDLKQVMNLSHITSTSNVYSGDTLMILHYPRTWNIVIENFTDYRRQYISSTIYIPLCIQLVDCFQQIHDLLKQTPNYSLM